MLPFVTTLCLVAVVWSVSWRLARIDRVEPTVEHVAAAEILHVQPLPEPTAQDIVLRTRASYMPAKDLQTVIDELLQCPIPKSELIEILERLLIRYNSYEDFMVHYLTRLCRIRTVV
jgi:hypothetical protein